MKRCLPLCLAFLSLIAVFPLDARGEDVPQGPVHIEADTLSYEKETDTYSASGDVEVLWDGTTLLSDMLSVDQKKNEAVAEGNVRLMKDDDLFKSDRITINLGTEQGEAINGELFIKKANFHVRGKRMAKVGKDDYHLEQGSFTTCDGDVPSWKFTANDIDVTLEEYASGRHAFFYIKDIPVFYTPYLLFPVKRERQSGFLIPRLGHSTKKGYYLDIPFYWVVSPSQEVTIDLDLQSRRGVGTGIDYRYIRKQGSSGSFRGYGIYDTSQDRFRGALVERHEELISETVRFASDVNLTTDRDFYRDYGMASGVYNQQFLDSTVSLTKRWESQVLAGDIRYQYDLEASNKETLQQLPTLTYTALRQRLGGIPLYVSLGTEFTNFYRDEGLRGERLAIHPLLAYYGLPFSGVELSAWGGYLARFYDASGADTGRGSHGDGLADAGATVSTSLARVYDVQWGTIRKVRHTLIPEVSYRYVQEKDQERLPFFDYNDRIVGQSILFWNLTNYVTGKIQGGDGPPVYRDLFYLRLGQGYQLSGSRRDLLTVTDEGRRFTDIRLEAWFKPIRQLAISTDNRFNPYQLHFSTAEVAADVTDDRGNFMGMGYQFERGLVEYLQGRVGLALVKPFIFNYTARYSFDKGGFLESEYAVTYKHQCWSITFIYQDRPDNKGYLVSFSLAGVGGVGPTRSSAPPRYVDKIQD